MKSAHIRLPIVSWTTRGDQIGVICLFPGENDDSRAGPYAKQVKSALN